MDKKNILDALAHGGTKGLGSKYEILKILLKNGTMTLTDLSDATKISMGGIHKYVEQLENVKLIKSKKINGKRFVSIQDYDGTSWLLESYKKKFSNAEQITYLNEYLANIDDNKFDTIKINHGNKTESLKEYLPLFYATRLSPIIGPFTTIALLDDVVHRLARENTSYEFEKIVEEELEKINHEFAEKFRILSQDIKSTKQLRKISEPFVNSRSFKAPPPKKLKDLLSED